MPTTALIRLAEYANTPENQLGDRALEFKKLYQREIPIPRSACLPKRTLKTIAEANSLTEKLSNLIDSSQLATQSEQTKTKEQLLNLFSKIELPPNIAEEIITSYHQYFQGDSVHILPSNSPNHHGSWVHDNVSGDANVIDSLLAVWAEVVFAQLISSSKKTPATTLLLTSPLLIEWAPEADAAGVTYTKDPKTGSKTEITIHGSLGLYHPKHSKFTDVIKVDVRTWNVVSKDIAKKETKLIRGHESLVSASVPINQQKQPILTRDQATQLAKISFKIKQQSLKQQKVHWLLVDHQLIINAIEPVTAFNLEETNHNFKNTQPAQQSSTATSLFISAGNPNKAHEQVSDLVDGIGVLRSEYTLAKFGQHPLHVLKSKRKRALLKQDLIKTITTYKKQLGDRPLIYRTQNFTSAELNQLKFATTYEPQEPNPYLGYRGGLKIATQSELFTFELEALKKAMGETKAVTGCMLPFIRTPGELRTAIDKISNLGLLHQPNFKIWLQLNTPENILNLAAYSLEHVSAVSLNVRSLHGLILGVDPDNGELMMRYPLPNKILTQLIKQTKEALETTTQPAHPTKLMVHMQRFEAQLATAAIKLGVNGLIVKPQVARIAKDCIIDTETSQVTAN